MTKCDTEIPPRHWNGDAKRNLKERVYSNRYYIWKQVFFLSFFVLSNTLFSFTTKAYFWQLLTAFNIIHFIYKIVHNLYLTSIALKTRICTVKQPTTANRKGWHKQYVHFSFHFFPGLNYRYSAHPCVFLDPGQNSLAVLKKASAQFNLSKSIPPVRVLEADELTADEVNFVRGHSHRLSVLWHARLDTWEEPPEDKTSSCFKVTVH